MSSVNVVDPEIQQGFQDLIQGKQKIVDSLQQKGQVNASMQDTFLTLSKRINKIAGTGNTESYFRIASLRASPYPWIYDNKNQLHTDTIPTNASPSDSEDGTNISSRFFCFVINNFQIDIQGKTYLDKPKVILQYKSESIDHIAQVRLFGYGYVEGGGDDSYSYDITDKIKASSDYMDLDLTNYLFPDYSESEDSKYLSASSAWRKYSKYWVSSTESDDKKMTFQEYICSSCLPTESYGMLDSNLFFAVFSKTNQGMRDYPFYISGKETGINFLYN